MVGRTRERGSSLIVAILASALVAIAVGLLVQDLNDRQRVFRHGARVIALTHFGDAALSVTLAELAADPEFPGFAPRRIDDGLIWSHVEHLPDGRVSITAEAEFDGWRGLLKAEFELGPDGPTVLRWRRSTRPS